MNISLPPELKRFVEKKVKDGLYANENEVVHDALRFFKERDALFAFTATMLTQNSSHLPSMANLSALGNIDVETQAFIVSMEAAKSAAEDLKSVMNEVKAINNAKAKMRELLNRINKDVASNAGQRGKKPSLDFSGGMGSERAYHQVLVPFADTESDGGIILVSTDLHEGKIGDVAQLKAIQDDLKSKLDSMSEMSEMT